MDLTPGFRNRFKGDPQQGTLFRASAKELDPTGQRYPRGYTPERRDEVWDAVGEVGYSNLGERFNPATGDAELPMLFSGEDEFSAMDDTSKRNWGEGRAVIRDAVARSTVPMDVVSRVQFGVTPNIRSNAFYGPKDDAIVFGRSAADAQQHREGFGSGYPTPETQRLDQGQTIIHELGHAADPSLEPLRGKRTNIIDRHGDFPVEGYTEPEDLGAAEQFADDFAEEHFRHDPRLGRKATFDTATASYAGAAPSDIPPGHLAGYEKWSDRSQRAAQDLRPRHEAAEREGRQRQALAAETGESAPVKDFPKTAEQARAVGDLRDADELRSPRLRLRRA